MCVPHTHTNRKGTEKNRKRIHRFCGFSTAFWHNRQFTVLWFGVYALVCEIQYNTTIRWTWRAHTDLMTFLYIQTHFLTYVTILTFVHITIHASTFSVKLLTRLFVYKQHCSFFLSNWIFDCGFNFYQMKIRLNHNLRQEMSTTTIAQ